MNIQNAVNDGFKFLIDSYQYSDNAMAIPNIDNKNNIDLQLSNFEHAIRNPSENPEPRILTGIPTLDKMFGEWEDVKGGGREFKAGLNKQDITLIGGMSGMGKTTFAFNLFFHLHKTQQNPIFFSLDMREKRAWNGLRKAMIGFTGTSAEFIEEIACCGSIPKMVTIQEIIPISAIDNFLSKNPTNIIFIDYIAKLKPSQPFSNEKQKFILLFSELKKLAEKYDCAILMLSQTMEDKGYKHGRPTLASIYGGVEVRSEVDHAIAVYRNSKYNDNLSAKFKNVMEIKGLKLRSDDSTDTCYARFVAGKITELTEAEKVDYIYDVRNNNK